MGKYIGIIILISTTIMWSVVVLKALVYLKSGCKKWAFIFLSIVSLASVFFLVYYIILKIGGLNVRI